MDIPDDRRAPQTEPFLVVERGAPSDEELAALVAALALLAGPDADRAAARGTPPAAPLRVAWRVPRDFVPPGSWAA